MNGFTHLIAASCALAALASPAAAGGTVVDFESGTEGWVGPSGGGGATNLAPGQGVGGSTGLRTVFNNFGITFRTSTNPAFVRDYTQLGSVTISVDTRVNSIDFSGVPVSRPWFLELRDYDLAMGGYPWTSVWFKFTEISAAPGYTTYSVTIDDTTSTTLPTGWEGYGDEDPVTFEPILPAGVTFADVLAGVDEVAFSTLEPGFFFGFTDFDVVLDNITIDHPPVDPWADLGGGTVGANGPDTLVGSGTLVPGTPVGLTLSGAPASGLTLGWVSFSSTPVPAVGGTLHTNPLNAQFFFGTDAGGGLAINTTWPPTLPPGAQAWFQFVSQDLSVIHGLTLSNGLRATTQ